MNQDGSGQRQLTHGSPTVESTTGGCGVHVRMAVQNFYPWLRGTGPFARVGIWIYGQTQQRIHRAVTRGFLRRLARTAPDA
ncbi:MAG: hypothetical protein WA701_05595 [Solirubrobacterales bacterium]